MSSRKEFNQALKYLVEAEYVEELSFNQRDIRSRLYGRVDNHGKSIAPLRTSIEQVGDTKVRAINFVVDAFADFTAAYNSMQYPIESIPEIRPKRGYINPLNLYEQHKTKVFNAVYTQHIVPNRDHIKNIDQFVEIALRGIREYSKQVPITYSRFLKSGLCPIHSSGLVIELTSESHSIDGNITKSKIIDSVSFEAYARNASKYGFAIMKNAPWALVANVASAPMINYAAQYVGMQADIHDSFYYNCRGYDLDIIKGSMSEYYDLLSGAHGEVTEHVICKDGTLITRDLTVDRPPAVLEVANYGDKKWFKLYIKILMAEENIIIPETKLDRLLENCYSLLIKEGFERSMDYAERKILKRKTDIYR